MGDLALLGAAFAFGVGSALLPVLLNAELYVVGMGAFVPESLLAIAILSLGVGTVVGKAIVFELVRRGSSQGAPDGRAQAAAQRLHGRHAPGRRPPAEVPRPALPRRRDGARVVL